ncbi:transcriptional regulator family: Fungal Specific TF [Purpureocillium lilacinum]|uniref:Transcriptional regulator family: Fungal Specific TF n=1 Tax=Purpureocillium lilacinum TaxID=33203 RepID=A0ABR0BQ04_PURLI|nr:transcriptional regulator family: Fungal Specific TF [Purpureocillium lilacinum]
MISYSGKRRGSWYSAPPPPPPPPANGPRGLPAPPPRLTAPSSRINHLTRPQLPTPFSRKPALIDLSPPLAGPANELRPVHRREQWLRYSCYDRTQPARRARMMMVQHGHQQVQVQVQGQKVGPLDARRRRSRCEGCARSHVKCSGGHPCSRCLKRRTACSYPDAQDTASPKHFILVNASGTPRPRSAASPAVPLADERLRLVGAFDLFARRNSFTGKTATCGDEVRALAGLHAGESGHLWEAMMALGAVYEARLGGEAALRKSRMVTALGHYARAISGLRTAIDKGMSGRRRGKSPAPEQTSILWTTLFLGLFELMNDASGEGWRQHMVHGTASALRATGPGACARGPGRAFFAQARIFEACRTILFNEPTFLTDAAWAELARGMWAGDDGRVNEWHPLDSLLDIMVMCSRLRVRAGRLMDDWDEGRNDDADEARAIYADGQGLCDALQCWHEAYAPDSTDDGPTAINSNDSSTLLALVFHAATRIYLSGIFDYRRAEWTLLCGGLAPTAMLPQDEVDAHVETILGLTRTALAEQRSGGGGGDDAEGKLSPLLFLFPLRIAGARARGGREEDGERRELVVELLGRVRDEGGVESVECRDNGDVDAEVGEGDGDVGDGDVESW